MKLGSNIQDDIEVFVSKLEQYSSALAEETHRFDCVLSRIQRKYYPNSYYQAFFEYYEKFHTDLEKFRMWSSELTEHLRSMEATFREIDEIDSHTNEMVNPMNSQKLTY